MSELEVTTQGPSQPASGQGVGSPAGVDLIELWGVVWRGKWLIAIASVAFGLVGVVYALTATKWYHAEVLLIPVKNSSANSVVSQLGGSPASLD